MTYVIRAGCVIDGKRYDLGDPPEKVESLVTALDPDRRIDLMARGTIGEIDDETGELKLRPRRRLGHGVMSDPTMDIPQDDGGDGDGEDNSGDGPGGQGGRRAAQGGWGQGGQGGGQTERAPRGKGAAANAGS